MTPALRFIPLAGLVAIAVVLLATSASRRVRARRTAGLS